MKLPLMTRRRFCGSVALGVAACALPAEAAIVSVAQVIQAERERILREADAALAAGIAPPPVRDALAFSASKKNAAAMIAFSATVGSLTAAFVATQDERYALRAGQHFFAWFVSEATRIANLAASEESVATHSDAAALMLALVPLAEVARALPFLADTAALSPPDAEVTAGWFRSFLAWLKDDRAAQIARAAKDHTGAAWLLLAATTARLLRDEKALDECRAWFKRPTLRNQISADGTLHFELATGAPLRYTLFDFDLLAAAVEVLTTPFASLWDVELEDGPGMRSLAAALVPTLRDRGKWPFMADTEGFRDVPLRRPGLLLAGRAYSRPEYVELWKTLPAVPPAEERSALYPIREVLLWVARAPHAG